MKLTIDFDKKMVSIGERVTLKSLMDTMKKMFPETWKDFELDINTIVYSYYPHYYWHQGYYTTVPSLLSGGISTADGSFSGTITNTTSVYSYGGSVTNHTSTDYKNLDSVIDRESIPDSITITTNPTSTTSITTGTYCIEVLEDDTL